MNCRGVEKYLCAQPDGALTDEQRAALVSHLAECAACRRLQGDLAATVVAWQAQAQSVRVPDAQIEWQKLRRELNGAAATRRRFVSWFALPLAAAAAVAIGLYVRPTPATTTSSTPEDAVARSATPTASQPQSTVVYVDDKSGWTFVWEPDNGGQHI